MKSQGSDGGITNSLRFPSIEEMRGSSALINEKSAISYEPYKVVDALGKRGLGGNAKLKQLQKEHREKQNRSMQGKIENKANYA